MLFVWIAIGAYFLFAVNGVIDKFLLSKVVRHPVAYAFYIGITGPLTWVLAPFGLKFLSIPDLAIAIAGGAAFVGGLTFLYIATLKTTISRLLPIEGGLVPFFTLILAYFILGERLSTIQGFAFAFLVAGAVLISIKKDKQGYHPAALLNAVFAAFLFALSFTLTKYIFDRTNFVSGLIWTRLGFLAVSLAFLIPRRSRRYIFEAPKEASPANKLLYYGARLSGGLAGLMQNYAISIGSVILVNALQGSQYAILLVMTTILSKYHPKILKEKISASILTQKIAAIVLITGGLVLLTL
jgi:drug/metabolite transporter (DMT)-like permease